ncbi:hypothetical protein PtA15_4A195 [Puccinia triticina]|uniref:Uncharacterized protein n=1 Tax=Puccinia triticina TaxID=208348 RepID=A0ABY7CIH6_9BASI|nr:uncharacterized protein PtA15_4A195 [Puccinia triticina]WAQ83747.1 hypothetical protein PtA15_4A195 [Puccinia triticina]
MSSRRSRTTVYISDRELPERFRELTAEGMDTDTRLRYLNQKINQVIQVCNTEARQFHLDIEAVEERINGLLRIIESRGMVGVPNAGEAASVDQEEADVALPAAAEEDPMDVDHTIEPHLPNEGAAPEANDPDTEPIPDNIEPLHGLVAAMKTSIARAVLSTMFNSELLGRITEEEKARLLSAAGIPREELSAFWSLLGTEQQARADSDENFWLQVDKYRRRFIIEQQQLADEVGGPINDPVQGDNDNPVEPAVMDRDADDDRVERAVVDWVEDDDPVEPAVMDRDADDGRVEPPRTIRGARRTVRRAEARIASAAQLLALRDSELLRTFYDEEEDNQAEHRRIQEAWYANREVRMRWEGADFSEDWADVVEEGEGYEDYMNRITGLLELCDMAEEAARRDTEALRDPPTLRVHSPPHEASPPPESIERSEAEASSAPPESIERSEAEASSEASEKTELSQADGAEEDWVDAAEERVITAEEQDFNAVVARIKQNVDDSEPVAGPSSKRARLD